MCDGDHYHSDWVVFDVTPHRSFIHVLTGSIVGHEMD